MIQNFSTAKRRDFLVKHSASLEIVLLLIGQRTISLPPTIHFIKYFTTYTLNRTLASVAENYKQ